jgi:cytochrome c biogenesis protein CcdA/thiol-disulfide isomerase/thioredoxin
MLILLLAYFGGVLTILSPCILPVLPFVFARGDKPFLTNGLPLLIGMAVTFAGVASLAAVGGEAALQANQWGRWIALSLFAIFGLLLLLPGLAERAMRPLVDLGNRLSADGGKGGIGSSVVLGAATGLLWAPCAGPILGIILTGAALSGASTTTLFLLLAYALGAATSLALALVVGGRVFAAMKRSIGAGERVRRALGLLILIGVGTIALGLDTRVLARLSTAQTFGFELGLARLLGVGDDMPRTTGADLPDEGPLPSLDGATGWLGGTPLTAADLKGKVVLVDFWTYSCINCIRAIPHIRALQERYGKDGLVIVGVHSPEFAFERDPKNVARAIREQEVNYPVAIDNKLAIWRAFNNRYWPATYIADAKGRLRYHHFGEGGVRETEAAVRRLLVESGRALGERMTKVEANDVRAAADLKNLNSPETYTGYGRADRFASPGGLARDAAKDYALAPLALNKWALGGRWLVGRESARSLGIGSRLSYRFMARDLHLVLGSASGRPVRFRVTVDGAEPARDAGLDVAADGRGRVDDQRLYQLVRQKGDVRERTFTITFEDPGAEVFAFTFG